MTTEKVTISVRMDKNVKIQFEKTCQEIGIKMSDAINIFAREVIREQTIPFPIRLKDYF